MRKGSSEFELSTYRQKLTIQPIVVRRFVSLFWGKVLHLYFIIYFDRKNVNIAGVPYQLKAEVHVLHGQLTKQKCNGFFKKKMHACLKVMIFAQSYFRNTGLRGCSAGTSFTQLFGQMGYTLFTCTYVFSICTVG